MADMEKIINAIEKAKKQSEEYAQDRIIVLFKEADMIIALLKEQEAVVRCKDCKYLTEKDMSENCDWHEYVCLKRDEWLYDLNWFCADGERRTNNA